MIREKLRAFLRTTSSDGLRRHLPLEGEGFWIALLTPSPVAAVYTPLRFVAAEPSRVRSRVAISSPPKGEGKTAERTTAGRPYGIRFPVGTCIARPPRSGAEMDYPPPHPPDGVYTSLTTPLRSVT